MRRYVHHQGSCRPGMPIIDYRFTSLKKLATLTDSIQIKLRMVQQSLSSATKRSGEDRIDSKNSQDDTDSHAAILLSQESAIEFCVNVLNSEKFALQICGKTKVTRAKKQGKQVDNSRQILYTKFLAILRSFCLSDMSYKILADCVEDFVNSKIGQNVQKDFKEFVIDDMQRTEFEIMENIPNANLKSDYLKKKMLQIIKIRNSKFLGITVISSHYNILVGRVIHGSFSHRNRLFQPGDEILEINDIPLKCRSVEEVINLINNSKSEIKFLVSKSNKSSLKDLLIPENLEPIYVKALYDYDPNEDAQIECPEIALPFFSGDILRIVEYSDTIWQAYIHGDDSQTIAGLIPGKMMFEERIKRELMGSANNSSSFCLPPIIRSPKSNPLIQVYEKLQLYSPPRGSNWLFLVICDEPCKKLRRSLANSKDLTLIRNPVKSTRLGQRQRDELEKFYGVPMVYMDDKEWRECETNSSEFFDFKSNHFDQNKNNLRNKTRLKLTMAQLQEDLRFFSNKSSTIKQ
ncbi:MAG: Maguk P55 subfamily member, variant 2 [Marteilia pararefringens]